MKSTTLSNCSIEIDKNAQSSEIEIDHLVKLLDLLLQLLTMNARHVHSTCSVLDLLLQHRVLGRDYFGDFLKVLNDYSGFSVCCTKLRDMTRSRTKRVLPAPFIILIFCIFLCLSWTCSCVFVSLCLVFVFEPAVVSSTSRAASAWSWDSPQSPRTLQVSPASIYFLFTTKSIFT